MRKQIKFVGMAVIAAICAIMAVEPNYTRTVTFFVNNSGDSTVTTRYNDGLNRSIESKLKLADDTDRVACTWYDDAGRPALATKAFVDTHSCGSYLPGTITDTIIRQQLEASNLNDTCAYSKTLYWDDPLGRVKTAVGPGEEYADYGDTAWTFGVSREDKTVTLQSGSTVSFTDGVITGIDPVSMAVSAVLDELYDTLLTGNLFTGVKNHFLSLSLSIDGPVSAPEVRISEELKDLFGRTVRTFSAPDIGSTGGSKIGSGYVHDIRGNVLTEQPPVASTNPIANTVYEYTSLGQLIRKESPDGGVFTYEYYDNGLPEKVILRKSDNTEDWGLSYEYDEHGRKTAISEIYYGYAQLTPIRFYYDDIGNIPRHNFSTMPEHLFGELKNLKGRLVATVITNRGNKTVHVGELYSYDDEGRVIRKCLSISGSPITQITNYEYDIHGKATAEFFYYGADHIKKRFKYDHLGRLVSTVQDFYDPASNSYPDSQTLVKYEYNDVGQLRTKELSAVASGTPYEVGYQYDVNDRVTEIYKPSNYIGFSESIDEYSVGSTILNARYHYHLQNINDSTTHDYTYTYDDVNRLTAAAKDVDGNVVVQNHYEYDAVGRFREKSEGNSTVANYEYYNGCNRLKRTGKNPMADREYVFDKRGNMVVDYTKNVVIEHDWRDLPVVYRFYDDLSNAGITKDGATGTTDIANLAYHMNGKVENGDVALVSMVVMVYDAGGNRVVKMEVQE